MNNHDRELRGDMMHLKGLLNNFENMIMAAKDLNGDSLRNYIFVMRGNIAGISEVYSSILNRFLGGDHE